MNLPKDKIQSQHKIIFTIIGIVLISVAIFYFIINPTKKNIIALKKEILNQKITFEKDLDQNRNIGKINEQFRTIEPDMEKFNNIAISKDEELKFITLIEEVATKNNISQRINLTPTNEKKGYQKTKLDITLSGNFINFINYLSDIQKLDHYINIHSVDITKLATARTEEYENQKDTNLHIKIVADTYWK